MSLQHRPLRSSIASIAITGAATLATVLAAAPAMADDTIDPAESTRTPESRTPAAEPADEPTEDATDAVDESTPDADATPDESSTEASTADEGSATEARSKRLAAAADEGEVVADFGYQKYRVGVQVADGSFVPEDGTVGSEFTITITSEGNPTQTIECTTKPFIGGSSPTGFSTCDPDNSPDPSPVNNALARSVTIEDGNPAAPSTYFLAPDETATIVQTKAVEGLEMSAATAVLGPCDDDPEPGCTTNSFPFGDAAEVLFENAGTPPDAVDDSATTDQGDAVDIDLLANDDSSIAPITSLEIGDDASNGTVAIDDQRVARYTPDAGFSGEDTFTYTLSTQNGTDTATVTVQVEADAVTPVREETDEPRAATAVRSAATSALPNTGGPDVSLLGYGALLLTGGGWLTLRSRRRVGATDRG